MKKIKKSLTQGQMFMSQHQSIPRTFRPQTFHEVFEQDIIVKILKNAIAMNRCSHAYIFCGSRGSGKTTLARIFAKALNCAQLSKDFEPCNACPSCLEITAGTSLDVLEIDGASNRGIDDIRQLSENTIYIPSSSPYKIYIIDEVHMLTKEAFNALLKTLEEPPPKVKFFFATTEPHKVLPTILSRCQRFDLKRISPQCIVKKLKTITETLNIKIDDTALYLLAENAEGSLRDAESLLDVALCFESSPITQEHILHLLGLSPQELFFSLDEAFAKNDLSLAFSITNQLYFKGKDLNTFLHQLIDHFQDLLKIKLDLSDFNQKTAQDITCLKKAAESYTIDQCLNICDFLLEQVAVFQQTPLKKSHIELILLHILRMSQSCSLVELSDKLLNLQKEMQKQPEQLPPPQKEKPIEENKKDPTPPVENTKQASSNQRYETLLRFAGVEFNGVVKKSH